MKKKANTWKQFLICYRTCIICWFDGKSPIMSMMGFVDNLIELDLIKSELFMSDENIQTYQTGFKRESKKVAPHLVCPELSRRLGYICQEGLNRYRDENIDYVQISTARFGGPLDNLVKHMQDHWDLWRAGNREVDHLAKIAWGIQQIMHQESQETEQPCNHYNIYLKKEDQVKA